jgi:nitroimidazol reductase NimA-like FMN-containing flavoprotein (pyridoxamine 5'-phosphate oxidase superfamily)
MARWDEIAAAEPEFAQRVWALFDAHKHKVLATVRKDGSPRVSGIELGLTDGSLWLGSMPGARKAADLRRDPRFALHSSSPDPPDDPTSWAGDAKLSGRAVEVTDPGEVSRHLGAASQPENPSYLFRLDIAEVVLTRVGDPADHLVVEYWREGEGLHRIERR